MFCSNCGNQAEEKASFCSRCGQPLLPRKGTDERPDQAIVFEVCEIVWEETDCGGFFAHPRAKFFAKAIGPRGKYTAAESEEFALEKDGGIDSDHRYTLTAHDSIVQQLVQDGWQPTEGTSTTGFACKFKRIVSRREKAQRENLELYFFWAKWCQACRQASPDLSSLATEFFGKLSIKRFDADVSVSTVKRFKIEGLPTYVFLKSGQECERITGAMPREKLAEVVRRLS